MRFKFIFRTFVTTISVLFAIPSSSLAQQDLWGLVSPKLQVGHVNIPTEGTTGRADFDGAMTIAGSQENPPVMSAPNDDAVIVAQAGSVVKLSNIVLRQAGQNKFGIYINGGRVEIDGCVFDGAFDTAIYIAAGSLQMNDCKLNGARNGISAQDGADVEIALTQFENINDVSIFIQNGTLRIEYSEVLNGGTNSVYLQGNGSAEIKGLSIEGSADILLAMINGFSGKLTTVELSGAAKTGFLGQNAGNLQLSEIRDSPKVQNGIVIQGAANLDLRRFELQAWDAPLRVSGVAGKTSITAGVLRPTPEAYGAVISDNQNVNINEIDIKGGELGLFLRGKLPDLRVENSRFTGQSIYGIAIQDIDDGSNGQRRFHANYFSQSGKSLGFAAINAGSVEVVANNIIVTGKTAAYFENTIATEFADNGLVVAPVHYTQEIALYANDGTRRIVPDGPVEAIQGLANQTGKNLILSHTGLLRTASSEDAKFAIADYIDAKTSAPVLAMEIALQDAHAAKGVSETVGIRLVTLQLNPAETGERWSNDAHEIQFESSKNIISVSPRDFPFALPIGQYKFFVDDEYVNILNIDTDQNINLPLPAGPYLAWKDEAGQAFRGPTFAPRAPNALRALADGLRRPHIGEYWGGKLVSLSRAGADGREAVIAAKTSLPGIMTQKSKASDAEDWPANSRYHHMRRMYFEILAAFGTAEDVDWIFDSLSSDDLIDVALETAVRIEQRLGLIASGRNMDEAIERMKQAPNDVTTRQLIVTLARTGYGPALAMAARLQDQAINGDNPYALGNLAFVNMMSLDPAIGLPMFRSYLDRLARNTNIYLTSETEISWQGLNSSFNWRDAALAWLYLSKHGGPEDRTRLSFPIPSTADYRPLMMMVNDPASLLSAYLGVHNKVAPYRINSWMRYFGETVCQALALSTPARHQAVFAESRYVMRTAVLRDIVTDYYEKDSLSRRSVDYTIDTATAMSVGHCWVNGEITELAMGENAAGEESRKFSNNDYNPDWWVRPVSARNKMEAIGQKKDYASVTGLSIYPTDWLMEIANEQGNQNAEFLEIFKLHHGLLTDGFQSPQNFFSFGSERRIFRLRNGGGDGTLSIAGHVDVRLLPKENKLIIAIAHNIISPDYGGIAAMMTEPDRAPYEVDNRIKMFEYVRVDKGSESVDATFAGNTNAGVLLYEIPFDGDLSDTHLRIGMRFMEERWPLDFALYESQLAYDRMQQTTTIELPGALQ